MSDLNRAADVAALEARIASLETQLHAAKQVASTYEINTSFSVRNATTEADTAIVFNVLRNGKAVTFHVSAASAEFYKNDVATLATELCEKTFDALMKDDMREQFMQQLVPAVANAAKMKHRGGV